MNPEFCARSEQIWRSTFGLADHFGFSKLLKIRQQLVLYRAVVDARLRLELVHRGLLVPGVDAPVLVGPLVDFPKHWVFSQKILDRSRCLHEIARVRINLNGNEGGLLQRHAAGLLGRDLILDV